MNSISPEPWRSLTMDPSWFWNRVERTDGCWLWTGGRNRFGYGQAKKAGKSFLTHRAAFMLSNRYLFLQGHVLHKCDNPLCCNPDHLFAGSHAENMADMKSKGRRKGVCTGEGNGRAKLTQQLCEQIRRERASGAMLKELAPKYNVGLSTISRVCRGENWK